MKPKKSQHDRHTDSFSARLSAFIRPYAPFTALNTVWRGLDKRAESILDVGCGKGEPMKFINRRRNFNVVGADIFQTYIKEVREKQVHNDYVLCDVRNLPFKSKSFDTVICMEVLEHFDKQEGEKLLLALEDIARKQVILSTPLGKYEQKPYDNNPHQEHKYIWSLMEMKGRGYKVRACGIRGIGGREGIISRLPQIFILIGNIFWVLAGPVVRLFPSLGGDMVCEKRPENTTTSD